MAIEYIAKILDKKIISYFFLFFLSLNLILASIGGSMTTPLFLSFIINLFFWGVLLTGDHPITFPRYFKLYVLFLAIGLLHYIFFKGNIKLYMILVSGAIYWITAYNFKSQISKLLPFVLQVLSVVIVIFFLVNIGKDLRFDVTENLFHPTATSKHNHIGDLFALTLVSNIKHVSAGFRFSNIVFIVVSLIFMAISYSRSAVVSLLISIAYLFSTSKNKQKISLFLKILFVVGVSLVVYFGLQKTTIFSRPYFAESFWLLLKNPFGIGFGNFPLYNHNIQVVHSIIMEIIVGYGLFSIVWIYWFYISLTQVLKSDNNKVLSAVYLGIITNLAFDRTYLIPTFVWLLFVILGVLEQDTGADVYL